MRPVYFWRFYERKTMGKLKKNDLFGTEIDVKKTVERILKERDKRNAADEKIKGLHEELMDAMHTAKKNSIAIEINDETVNVYIDVKEKIKIDRD